MQQEEPNNSLDISLDLGNDEAVEKLQQDSVFDFKLELDDDENDAQPVSSTK